MSDLSNNSLIGFFCSFDMHEELSNREIVKHLVWGEKGLKNKLSQLNWQDYGSDLQLILFQIYSNPIPYQLNHIKLIGSYRKKEQSIGVSIILNNQNFFMLNNADKYNYLCKKILERLDQLNERFKKNKLNIDTKRLINDVQQLISDKT